MQQLTSRDFYFCYNKHKKHFLLENGFTQITTAFSVKDNQQFWLFMKSNELAIALSNYKKYFE